jgi:hypothetical protein
MAASLFSVRRRSSSGDARVCDDFAARAPRCTELLALGLSRTRCNRLSGAVAWAVVRVSPGPAEGRTRRDQAGQQRHTRAPAVAIAMVEPQRWRTRHLRTSLPPSARSPSSLAWEGRRAGSRLHPAHRDGRGKYARSSTDDHQARSDGSPLQAIRRRALGDRRAALQAGARPPRASESIRRDLTSRQFTLSRTRPSDVRW